MQGARSNDKYLHSLSSISSAEKCSRSTAYNADICGVTERYDFLPVPNRFTSVPKLRDVRASNREVGGLQRRRMYSWFDWYGCQWQNWSAAIYWYTGEVTKNALKWKSASVSARFIDVVICARASNKLQVSTVGGNRVSCHSWLMLIHVNVEVARLHIFFWRLLLTLVCAEVVWAFSRTIRIGYFELLDARWKTMYGSSVGSPE